MVVVGEIDGSLGMREVESVSFDFGPRIRSLHVLERAPMLQQYLHSSLGCDVELAIWLIRVSALIEIMQ